MWPREWLEKKDLSRDLRFLEKQSQYRRIVLPGPDELDSSQMRKIAREALGILDSAQPVVRGPKASQKWVPFARDALSGSVIEYLLDRDLASPLRGNGVPTWEIVGPEIEQYLVPPDFAYGYLGLLAQVVAERDSASTIPATDHPYYQHLIFDSGKENPRLPAISIAWSDIIPVPRNDVTLAEIIDFKLTHQAELIRFRSSLSTCERAVADAKSPRQAKEAIADLSGDLRSGLTELREVLQERRIATVSGSLTALINVKSSTFWAAAAVAADKAADLAKVPLAWAMAGIAVSGAIELASHLIQKRNERRATLRQSPYAYLYHASEKKLIVE